MALGNAFHKRGEYTYMKYWIFVALFLLGATISYAQYNVAPPTTCLNTNANWDGTNWTCTTSADTINTTSTPSSQTAKQTLLSRALPAGYLAVNGQCINIIAWGIAKANNNTKTQTIDFGATTIATTGAVVNNNGAWKVWGIVCRTSATAQAAVGDATSATTVSITNTTPAETLANSININITSTNQTDTDGTTIKGLIVVRIN